MQQYPQRASEIPDVSQDVARCSNDKAGTGLAFKELTFKNGAMYLGPDKLWELRKRVLKITLSAHAGPNSQSSFSTLEGHHHVFTCSYGNKVVGPQDWLSVALSLNTWLVHPGCFLCALIP